MERHEIREKLRHWQEGQIMRRQKQSKWREDKRELIYICECVLKGFVSSSLPPATLLNRGTTIREAVLWMERNIDDKTGESKKMWIWSPRAWLSAAETAVCFSFSSREGRDAIYKALTCLHQTGKRKMNHIICVSEWSNIPSSLLCASLKLAATFPQPAGDFWWGLIIMWWRHSLRVPSCGRTVKKRCICPCQKGWRRYSEHLLVLPSVISVSLISSVSKLQSCERGGIHLS